MNAKLLAAIQFLSGVVFGLALLNMAFQLGFVGYRIRMYAKQIDMPQIHFHMVPPNSGWAEFHFAGDRAIITFSNPAGRNPIAKSRTEQNSCNL